VKFIYETRL